MSTESVIVDCARIPEPDFATIGRLARVQLEARRKGLDLRLRNTTPPLLELIWLAGLDRVLRVEVKRQSEQREKPRGIEEEGELPDPSV
jgi:anti-anti-sigma regulatory factor